MQVRILSPASKDASAYPNWQRERVESPSSAGSTPAAGIWPAHSSAGARRKARAFQESLAQTLRARKRARDRGRLLHVFFAGGEGWSDCPSVRAVAGAYRACSTAVCRQAFRMLVLQADARAPRLLATSAEYPDLYHPAYADAAPEAVYVDALRRLAEQWRHWRRPVHAWRPESRNPARQFSQLARHLLARYPVPKCMDSVFFLAHPRVDDGWFRHVAGGGSLRSAPGLPVPLTKWMAHHALLAPEGYDLIRALRWGQVIGSGGTARLARLLAATPLGRELWGRRAEEWWLTVIQWFVNHPLLAPVHVGPVVDYLAARRFGGFGWEQPDPDFTMPGRSPVALLRLVEEWHCELRRFGTRTASGRGRRAFRPSGLGPGRWSSGREEVRRIWTVTEILSVDTLAEEGRAMRHCVATYADAVERGEYSVWSLRCDRAPFGAPARRLTIGVYHRTRAVVEARGACNRLPTDEELRLVRLWAAQNGLSVEEFDPW